MTEVREVLGKRDIIEFIRFPLRLYRGCRSYVPALYSDERKHLEAERESRDTLRVFFLASKEGKTVGRIEGLIQKNYNAIHNKAQVRFCRFDCIDDTEVARALFCAVEDWGAAHGMNEICGPLGENDLEREGLLVEGFSEDATFEEQYNYEYYKRLVEEAGFSGEADWVEFELRYPSQRNTMLSRVAARTLEMHRLHIADSDMPKRQYIDKYREGFFECLDICYRDLYGTVPISKKAQDELIEQFMLIVNKKYLIIICDENERVVAFGLCFPSIGEALKKSGGKLTPAALVRVLRAVRHPRILDLGLVAVLPEYRNAAINAVILDCLLNILEEGSVEKCETNLNLETNTQVIAQWKYFDARCHKRRRSYIKNISAKGEEKCSNS